MILKYASDIQALVPESFLLCAAMLLLAVGAWVSTSAYYQYPVLLPKFISLAILSLVLTLLLVLNNPDRMLISAQEVFSRMCLQ